MLKKINPLNVHRMRRAEYCPSHFETITIEIKYNLIKAIDEWIFFNAHGRYYVGNCIELDSNKKKSKIKIGFERSSELSYFMLACPHLKYT